MQACKLKFRLREHFLAHPVFVPPAALAVCFEGSVAGLDATETGNELSQPTFEFTSLAICDKIKIVPNLPLTSKQKFRFSTRPVYWNATFVLVSKGGLTQPEWSPCS